MDPKHHPDRHPGRPRLLHGPMAIHRCAWAACLAMLALAALAGCVPAQSHPDLALERKAAETAFADAGADAQALAVAAATGDAATVGRLMREQGVDPDTLFGGSDGGLPLLAWPIVRGNPEGLRALLEHGADPDASKAYETRDRGTRHHANAMVLAAGEQDQTYLTLLLDHGGDPDTRNANNEALLFHSFINGNLWKNVQLLVERGADVNASVSGGRTIANIYAARGGFMMTHWLLEHGADPRLDYVGGAPVRRDDSHTIESIFWHPGSPDDPTWQIRCQRWLLQHGHQRPPMPDHYRRMRETFGFPHREDQIPLPDGVPPPVSRNL